MILSELRRLEKLTHLHSYKKNTFIINSQSAIFFQFQAQSLHRCFFYDTFLVFEYHFCYCIHCFLTCYSFIIQLSYLGRNLEIQVSTYSLFRKDSPFLSISFNRKIHTNTLHYLGTLRNRQTYEQVETYLELNASIDIYDI